MAIFSVPVVGKNKKLIRTLEIVFFDEKTTTIIDSGQLHGNEFELVHIFLLYYSKILYNLGQSKESEGLIQFINDVTGKSIDKEKEEVVRLNILEPGFKLLEDENGAKIAHYTIEYYEREDGIFIINTHFSAGKEKTLVPLSLKMFLQLLTHSLSEQSLSFLMAGMLLVNDYYAKAEPYYELISTIEAPLYALSGLQDELDKSTDFKKEG